MALQTTDLLVIHRPGADNGTLYSCSVQDFFDITIATEDKAGLVRFATVAEVIQGGSNQLVISPFNLAEAFKSPLYVFDGNSVAGDDDYDTTPVAFSANTNPAAAGDATETTPGIVRLATSAETIAGTIDNAAITPAGLRSALNDPTYVLDAGEYAT